VIDNMLETMEKYGQKLEEMIEERTNQLRDQKAKTERLLHSLMPKHVSQHIILSHHMVLITLRAS